MQTRSADYNYGRTIISTSQLHARAQSMTTSEWIAVPDNPRQRDTERRLKNATHLIPVLPTHLVVSAAFNRATNEMWKLDGHTRALLWSRHPELAPIQVLVNIYEVNSTEEAAELYTHFDNPLAVETPRDRLSGSLHELGWTPSSNFMRNMNYTLGLARAEGIRQGNVTEVRVSGRAATMSIYQLVPLWFEELKALDELNLVSRKFKSQIFAAALLTLRRRGTKRGIEFWHLYNTDQGVKLTDEIDGVEALTRLVANHKASDRTLLPRAISCFESWRLKKTYSAKAHSSPKSTDLVKYMMEAGAHPL